MHFSEVEKHCKNCNRRLILRNNRDVIKKKFCSFYCNGYYHTMKRNKIHPELLQKFIKASHTIESNTKKGHKGKAHPKWKGGYQTHICKICNTSFLVPITRHNKGYGKCCSKKCYNKYHKVEKVKTLCLNCNKEIIDLPKKNRKFCSCSCRAMVMISKQKFLNTDIELKIKEFLEKEKIQFKFQPFIKNIVNADFLVYPNIVIFADGDYWHNLPSAVNRDKIVNEQLDKNHYKVLRFKGSEINKNFESVKNQIMETYNA